MSTTLIEVRAKRSFTIHGRTVDTGQIVRLAPLDAALAVGSTRAEYVDPDDRVIAVAALRKADELAAHNVRRPGDSWVKNF
jgi:hypothetical protein